MILLSPTYNNGFHPNMEHFITEMKNHNLSGRTIALVENGSWSPSAAKHITAALADARNMTILEPSVTIKSSVKDVAPLISLADTVAQSINA